MYRHISHCFKALGVADRNIDLFEGQYPVPDGMTYNSYLIEAPAPVVMDTVDTHFTSEWLDNLREALDGRTPAALVSLHLEPDHSGSVEAAMREFPEMKLVVSAKAAAMLPKFFAEADNWADRIVAVAEGDTFTIEPDHDLKFIMAPMVHWPEVMVAYDTREATLFSADAFGTFGIHTTLPTPTEWADEAARYYFNICGKYGTPVLRLLGKAARLDICRICPLHGPVIDNDIAAYLSLYQTWGACIPEIDGGVLVAYASIYGHTARAATSLAETLGSRGIPVKLIDLARTHPSLALSEAFRNATTVLAASSYDGAVFPPMSDLLSRLALKGWGNRRVALIENASWAPSANRTMRAALDAMKGIEIVGTPLTLNARIDASADKALAGLADAIMTY